MKEFYNLLIDILIKIFQIVFAMLVVGLLLQDKFNHKLFITGIIASTVLLTCVMLIKYNLVIKGDN